MDDKSAKMQASWATNKRMLVEAADRLHKQSRSREEENKQLELTDQQGQTLRTLYTTIKLLLESPGDKSLPPKLGHDGTNVKITLKGPGA
ncbi:MAG: hypothetical protein LQ346_005613, partial [Caloplaca aetnensis]